MAAPRRRRRKPPAKGTYRDVHSDQDFGSIAEVIAYVQTLGDEGDELQVHDAECPADEGRACECEPLIVTVPERARA